MVGFGNNVDATMCLGFCFKPWMSKRSCNRVYFENIVALLRQWSQMPSSVIYIVFSFKIHYAYTQIFVHSWVRANLHLLLITVLTGQYRIDKLLRMFIGKHLTAATAKPGCRAAPTRVLRRHLSAWSSDHWPLSRGRQELRGPARPIPMCTIMN